MFGYEQNKFLSCTSSNFQPTNFSSHLHTLDWTESNNNLLVTNKNLVYKYNISLTYKVVIIIIQFILSQLITKLLHSYLCVLLLVRVFSF